MTTHKLYPLTFDPIYKDYVWGGRNLAEKLGRPLPDGIVAESWDVAAHPNGSSIVNNGPLQGNTLAEVFDLWGEDLVGSYNEQALALDKFPLLIKLLDANRWLSVQVHPNDEYGLAHEGEFGKTEMWVVLAAEPGAEIIYGFMPGVTREQYALAVADGRAADLLHRLPVQKGDVIFVPAGAIHALGPGIIVAEIQQNSDTTYRIYDWGRPRPIHLEQALAVLDFTMVEPGPAKPHTLIQEDGLHVERLALCPYFETDRITLPRDNAFYGLCDGATFELWAVLEGKATLEWSGEPLTLQGVSWTLLPAELGEFQVIADERCTLLRVIVPEPGTV
ncbi:MAG: class I mannose-6-phosphate isomerase [Caldilineaceae bacterium]|nr:class I mannose-6-phosphate isomerase [Caldilineaceae bacterium]